VNISERENITLLSGAAEAIADYSGGDLRRAINALHTAAVCARETVDVKTVLRVIGEASPKQVQLMLSEALGGDFIRARKMMYNLMGTFGLSGSDIIRQMNRELFKVSYLTEEEKAELVNIIGEYDFRLTEGANPDIQLGALLARFRKFAKLKGQAIER
jgi:replication factor C small subunit